MTVKRADWVKCKGFNMVGLVKRVSKDGSWADVDWRSHTKRMNTKVLEVQHTIPYADWVVTDVTRKNELEA